MMKFRYVLTLERFYVSADDSSDILGRSVARAELSETVLRDCRLGGRFVVQEEAGGLCDEFVKKFGDTALAGEEKNEQKTRMYRCPRTSIPGV